MLNYFIKAALIIFLQFTNNTSHDGKGPVCERQWNAQDVLPADKSESALYCFFSSNHRHKGRYFL